MKFLFGSREKKFNNKKAFTYVEVIMVIVLISFLWLLATKVIKHNNNNKVPLFVYYLYKNLEKEAEIIKQKVSQESGSNKVEDVISSMDGKKYCETFGNDLNTIGKVNCNDLSDENNTTITYSCERKFNHVVNADGSFLATYTPSLEANKTIEDYKDCDSIKNVSNFICKYKPSYKFEELAIPNTGEFLYNCSASSVDNIDIDNRQLSNIKTHFKSTNNIYFNILTSKKHKYDFNLSATQGDICKANFANGGSGWDSLKDKIIIYDATNSSVVKGYHISSCTDAKNLWNDPLNKKYNFSNKTNISCCGTTKNKNNLYLGLLTPPVSGKSIITIPDGTSFNKIYTSNKGIMVKNYSDRMTFYIFYYRPSNGVNGSQVDEVHHSFQPQRRATINSGWTLYQKDGGGISSDYKAFGNLLNATKLNVNDAFFKVYSNGGFAYNYPSLTSGAIGSSNVAYQRFRYYYKFANMSDYLNSPCQTYLDFLKQAINYKVWKNKTFETNPKVISFTFEDVDVFKFQNSITLKGNNNVTLKNNLTNEFSKWINYFNLSKQSVQSKKALTNKTFNENDSVYKDKINHFIYVSIDTPFEKGKMGENVFVFEHFGKKIIPVGYLANNLNTPLKFDVVTRDLQTFKLKKVNKKPLTFCEAMVYTGDKFSPYCECKNPMDQNSSLMLRDGYYNWYDPTNWNADLKAKRDACDNKFGCTLIPVKPSVKNFKGL